MINSKSQVLLHLIDYLTDENIGKLICYFYGIKDYTNPYNSHREMLINILFGNLDNLKFSAYLLESVLNDWKSFGLGCFIGGYYNSKRIHSDKKNKFLLLDEYLKQNNYKYYKTLNPLSGTNDKYETEKYIKEAVNFYNRRLLPVNNYSIDFNPFKDYFLNIVDAIRSFDIHIKTSDKSRYKKYLNNIIKRIIETKEFYKFEEEYDGNKNVLLIIDFSPIKDNIYKLKVKDVLIIKNIKYCVYIQGGMEDFKIEGISTVKYKDKSTQSLIGSPDTTNFDKKLEEIDKAVTNYLNTKKTCKMCGRPYSKRNRCKDCQELMNLILSDNKDRFKKNKYNVKYAIEKLKFAKSSYSNSQLRKIHYENVKNLLKNVKITNKVHVEELVNKMFGDIEPFYF